MNGYYDDDGDTATSSPSKMLNRLFTDLMVRRLLFIVIINMAWNVIIALSYVLLFFHPFRHVVPFHLSHSLVSIFYSYENAHIFIIALTVKLKQTPPMNTQ